MCGVAGGFSLGDKARFAERVRSALTRMQHRGPDDSGCVVVDEVRGALALGQTRLSVIDLSSGGHQPMSSEDGNLNIVFNGEIYNYRELRRELQALGRTFRSESDTEVLLAAWREWGASCLSRLEGMFALAIHDRERHTLTCARDAFGIKPLFYEQTEAGFLFASEQQALTVLRGRAGKPDLQRAYDYLVNADYDTEERTFLHGVRHLMPGTLIELDLSSTTPAAPVRWWRPLPERRFAGSFNQAAEAVREQFLRSVRLHLRSDVPLGAALSGGIDSSALVCAIRKLEPDAPIHTFSYVADAPALSEERWVDLVNAHVGATPHKVSGGTDDLFRDLDALIALQGEPFGGTSIYAQYRIFEQARISGMKVTLDGQGADELLAGYSGYPGRRMLSLFETRSYRAMRRFARQWGAWPGRSSSKAWLLWGQSVAPEFVYQQALRVVGQDAHPSWLNLGALRDAGVSLRSTRPPTEDRYRGRRVTEQLTASLQGRGLMHLLRHADRNAMAFSIESRVPFLTLPLAELLLSLPEEFLISDEGETKHVFRAAMRGIVPDAILDRRDKIGFVTPQASWLRKRADTVRDRLRASAAIPFLSASALLRAFDASVSRKSTPDRLVWRWLNYVSWYEKQGFD